MILYTTLHGLAGSVSLILSHREHQRIITNIFAVVKLCSCHGLCNLTYFHMSVGKFSHHDGTCIMYENVLHMTTRLVTDDVAATAPGLSTHCCRITIGGVKGMLEVFSVTLPLRIKQSTAAGKKLVTKSLPWCPTCSSYRLRVTSSTLCCLALVPRKAPASLARYCHGIALLSFSVAPSPKRLLLTCLV